MLGGVGCEAALAEDESVCEILGCQMQPRAALLALLAAAAGQLVPVCLSQQPLGILLPRLQESLGTQEEGLPAYLVGLPAHWTSSLQQQRLGPQWEWRQTLLLLP